MVCESIRKRWTNCGIKPITLLFFVSMVSVILTAPAFGLPPPKSPSNNLDAISGSDEEDSGSDEEDSGSDEEDSGSDEDDTYRVPMGSYTNPNNNLLKIGPISMTHAFHEINFFRKSIPRFTARVHNIIVPGVASVC